MIGGLAVLNIFIAGVALALGLFLLLGKRRDRQRLLFAMLNIATGVWILANYFGSVKVYPLVLTDYVTGALMGLLLFLFSLETRQRALKLTHNFKAIRSVSTLATVVATAVVECMILFGLVVTTSFDPARGADVVSNGVLYPLYPLTIFVLASFSLYNLIRSYVKSRDAIQKTRVKLMLVGLSVAFICIAVPNLILENIFPDNQAVLLISYDSAYFGILVFLAVSTYAIVKHGLFDIKLAAVRSAAYILAILTLSLIYYLIAYLASLVLFNGVVTSNISLSPVNILLALILAFIFQPIKIFFDRITDDIFYRDNYKSEVFFAKLSELLTSTIDLRDLLESASREISRTFKADQAFFFIHYTNGVRHRVSTGTQGHALLPIHDAFMLDDYIAGDVKAIYVTDAFPDGAGVKKMLRSHRISLVMPLRQGEQVVGYLFLGDRLSGNYTKRDINTLLTISNELVIAIQNALSLHEVKELNETLQQRIDVATKELRSSNAQLKHLDEVKDEFMSMASHQLRTPLTSVKGYISMVLEGDAGKISPQQHKLLVEAFKSSERMVGLIADFLNVSRLQTGKFIIEKTSFDLKDVVKQEAKDLELIANSHDIKLRAKLGSGEFPLVADEQKLRQVIMNFIDNAIYYSHPGSTIIINLEQTKNVAALTIVDTGIGVPADEQARLFNKFFRAQNARKARPDGTGVGLYLARRVISAHGGQIIFSSKEGKGSTFGFRLPLSEKGAAPKEAERALVAAGK